MKQRYHNSQKEVKGMNTEELREQFLVDQLMVKGEIKFTYSHYDRVIVGGAVPTSGKLNLENFPMLRANYFLERREMGIINVGGNGKIEVDGKTYDVNKKDCLYIGRGSKNIYFSSASADKPALFYILSTPAHKEYDTTLMKESDATPVTLGAAETSNHRTIYKYIFADGIQSCQLVMGLTILNTGSVWNTMPAHVHDRRMEAYFYFDLAEDQTIFHFMGEPQETRHITIHNNEAVISPPWSIHSGCGTSNYSFIWGMGGENQDYGDMDPVKIIDLK
ncbi:5-dehydro-4-deoxy-D-glucuronate isomerase [Pedobacter sp. SD-b]|uniref:4-deoxy-L-threo-5-hexosulose-uronate ketol-isomerase n=1 Tax=Pedobacter segetis TaxID=2793069 RepID=A0ABS1BG01_9SPHI|nr:5-dehydro-4-deoxy-D-glucuronate isomerase [Pedobacter segetis]MBK0381788.1 5-dehydro-4-deoxy-D-glucuronate isomerase [Pedobacter segetis]